MYILGYSNMGFLLHIKFSNPKFGAWNYYLTIPVILLDLLSQLLLEFARKERKKTVTLYIRS